MLWVGRRVRGELALRRPSRRRAGGTLGRSDFLRFGVCLSSSRPLTLPPNRGSTSDGTRLGGRACVERESARAPRQGRKTRSSSFSSSPASLSPLPVPAQQRWLLFTALFRPSAFKALFKPLVVRGGRRGAAQGRVDDLAGVGRLGRHCSRLWAAVCRTGGRREC